MAVRALPPGAARRRAFFGLFDADGWTAAFFKALFWFLLIIFLLGYLPDRAYYFTVAKTVDVGFNAISFVNLCPASNGPHLPCPAPAGSVVGWQPSPAELALPQPRADGALFQSGTNVYVVGGRTPDGPTAETLGTVATTEGNLAPWSAAPPLPEPRANAAVASLSGIPYVIGGVGPDGAPTTTVYQGIVEQGALTGWNAVDMLTLPVALSDAMAVPTAAGIFVMGGRTADGLSATVYRSTFGEAQPPTLGAWEDVGVPLPSPRADAAAVLVGDHVFVIGGEGPEGVTQDISRLTLAAGDIVEAAQGSEGSRWEQPTGRQQLLPEPRARASSLSASGTIYILGGVDASGQPQASNLWAIPTSDGGIPAWHRQNETDLADGRAGSGAVNIGSFAFVIGGEGPGGLVDGSMRADIAPAPPFFRLGLFGATVPALAIQGEIGQQLGYINAFGLAMANFVILIAIGVAFSHRQATMRLIQRISRGRVRAPREEEFPVHTEVR